MKNVIVFIIFLFTGSIGFNQTDNVEIRSFELSECISGDGCEREKDYRIINSEYSGDTLNLSVKGIANCSGIHNIKVSRFEKEVFINFEAGEEVEYSDTIGFSIDKNTQDTVFQIGRVSLSSSSECDCFYNFYFNILGLERGQSYHYYINGKIVLESIPRWVIEKDSLEKDSVLSLISEIKEVKYHKSPVKYVICKIIPENLGSDYYYQVKVYEMGNHKTSFEFNVYPNIDYKTVYYYYDCLELSLDEWRKYRVYPEWNVNKGEPLVWLEMIKIIKVDRNDTK